VVSFQQPSVFAEAREIHIRLKQLLRLGMTIIERVDEVEADIAPDQIEARRTPAFKFSCFFGLLQDFLSYQVLSNH
jgi:hypothetical protein